MNRKGLSLLMTRPLSAAQRFVDLLPSEMCRELPIIYSPLMEIAPLQGLIDLGGIDAVIFTSGEGVRVASAAQPLRLRAYCVGERTASAACEAGWSAQFVGDTADTLVEALLASRPSGKLLHLHGEYTRGAVAERLSEGGVSCSGQAIYRQALCPLSAEAEAALTAQIPLIVPLFSPRTAAHFDSLCPEKAHLSLIAMSDAVAEAMPRLQSRVRHVSKFPTAEAMAELVCDVAAALLRVETKPPED
ncbi:Uroporphyrinogen III synthase HEM4 [Ruegeria sp. TM1040]|nr:Uroporphyrinogen III synthase HEM4 [Ruegeria sp. TM1040]